MKYHAEYEALEAAKKAYANAHWRREAHWREKKPFADTPDPIKEAIETYLNFHVAPPKSFA